MQRIKIFLAIFLASFILPLTVSAKIAKQELATVAQDEVIDDDLFIGGETVLIEGTINGDLYVAGGSVIVKGTVNGDILAAGGTIDISGRVRDDVRAAGGNINLRNVDVGDSVTLAGGNITVDEDSSIGGGLVLGAGNVTVNAKVGRGITGGMGNLLLNSSVGKDINIGVGTVTLGPSTRVAGDLNYTSDEELRIDKNAKIAGKTTRTDPDSLVDREKVRKQSRLFVRSLGVGMQLWSFLSYLATGVVFLLLFKKQAVNLATSVNDNFWKNMGWGLVILVGTPIIIIIAFFTVVGIPIAAILTALFAIEIYLTKIVFAIFAGGKLTDLAGKKGANVYLSLALGLIILFVLSKIPFVSFFATLTIILVGLGAVFNLKRTLLAKNRK